MKLELQAVAVFLFGAWSSCVADQAYAAIDALPSSAILNLNILPAYSSQDQTVQPDPLSARTDGRTLFAQLAPVSSGAIAQNNVLSSYPMLSPYDDFVRQSIEADNVRYWQVFDVGSGREPLVAYCQEDLTATGAMKGKRVRVRPRSAAAELFPQVTGAVGQFIASAELNVALQLGIIDCLGFGGEPVAAATSSDPKAFDAEAVDVVARSLGAIATDEIFAWESGNLEWAIYRATNGDLNEIYNLYAAFRTYGMNRDSPRFIHMAGYWAVRAIEHTPRGGTLQYDELSEAAKGNCKGRVEICKGIQIELNRIGQYTGAIDGIIGRGTSKAIEAITGTRQEGNLSSLITFREFAAARQPAQPAVEPSSKPTPVESSAGAPLALPDNLDDF